MAKFEKGFLLVEVAVVIVLVSIALTGYMQMMLKARQNIRASIQLSDASRILSVIGNALLFNIKEADKGNSLYITQLSALRPLPRITCTINSYCNPAQRAQSDLSQWKKELYRSFPDYQFIICRDVSAHDGTSLLNNGCDNKKSSPIAIKLWWSFRAGKAQFKASRTIL